MEAWFIWAGISLCAFSIWAIARHDWLRLTRPSRRVMARVTGHRVSWENSARSYAPIYTFVAEGGSHQVEDAVHSSFAKPEVGTLRELAYPDGHPELARPQRPLMWTVVYGFLLVLMALLFSRWMNWIH